MPRRKKPVESASQVTKRSGPALSPEAREQEMIALATDLAERQIREGTASSQVITHYLKLGTERERKERAKLEEEVKLLRAKTEAYETSKASAETYIEALNAIKRYTGRRDD